MLDVARLGAESVSLTAALPVVAPETWRRWNEDFQHLDQDDDGLAGAVLEGRWPGYISADDLRAFPGVFHSPIASGVARRSRLKTKAALKREGIWC